eukprot:tig00020934_g16120.t1
MTTSPDKMQFAAPQVPMSVGRSTSASTAVTPAATGGGVLLSFHVMCSETSLGDVVSVCGSADELGRWDASKSLQLETAPGLFPLWIGKVYIRGDLNGVKYKYIVRNPTTRAVRWEGLTDDRVLDNSGSEMQIYESWGHKMVRREVIFRSPALAQPSSDLSRVIDLIGQLRQDIMQGGRTLSDAGAVLRQKDNEIATLRAELERLKRSVADKEHALLRLKVDLESRK